MKAFEKNGLSYRPVQKINGGTQWRCDYSDGQYALAMVYKSKPIRQDVIEAIDLVNDRAEAIAD